VLASSIAIPLPLTRLPPWYPGQSGVPGTGTETGLRVHTTGAVFYVDPNYPGVSDLRHGTEPLYPLATVAAALTKCQPYRGDTILVMANNAWTWGNNVGLGWATPIAEEVTVNVPGVHIMGVASSGAVGVPWHVPVAGWAFTVNATDVLIEGFAFMGQGAGSNGVRAVWAGPPYGDNLVVRHCLFDANILMAISLEFVWYSEVMGCMFRGCNYGISCVHPGGSILANRYLGNWFDNCTLGAITVPEADDCLIASNWIHAHAPATDTFIDLHAGGNNMVADNWLGCPLGAAPGAYQDVNKDSAGDVWINNHCTDGPALSNP